MNELITSAQFNPTEINCVVRVRWDIPRQHSDNKKEVEHIKKMAWTSILFIKQEAKK